MTVDRHYIRSHIHELYGVIPDAGTEWRLRETDMTQDTHQGYIQRLHNVGGLRKVTSDKWGIVWETDPQLADALRDVATDVDGLSPEEAVICDVDDYIEPYKRA